jgi:hypothetical protein
MALHVIYRFKAEKKAITEWCINISIVSIFRLQIDLYRLIRQKIGMPKG